MQKRFRVANGKCLSVSLCASEPSYLLSFAYSSSPVVLEKMICGLRIKGSKHQGVPRKTIYQGLLKIPCHSKPGEPYNWTSGRLHAPHKLQFLSEVCSLIILHLSASLFCINQTVCLRGLVFPDLAINWFSIAATGDGNVHLLKRLEQVVDWKEAV